MLLGGVEAGAANAHLTIIAFLAATVLPAQDIVTAIEHIAAAGVTESQASLLLRALQSVVRRGAKSVRMDSARLRTLLETARRRPPADVWNRLAWFLRVRALTEIAG